MASPPFLCTKYCKFIIFPSSGLPAVGLKRIKITKITWRNELDLNSGPVTGQSQGHAAKAFVSGRAHSTDSNWEAFSKRNEALLRVIPRYRKPLHCQLTLHSSLHSCTLPMVSLQQDAFYFPKATPCLKTWAPSWSATSFVLKDGDRLNYTPQIL